MILKYYFLLDNLCVIGNNMLELIIISRPNKVENMKPWDVNWKQHSSIHNMCWFKSVTSFFYIVIVSFDIINYCTLHSHPGLEQQNVSRSWSLKCVLRINSISNLYLFAWWDVGFFNQFLKVLHKYSNIFL